MTIVCETEEQWRALCRVMGDPAWAREERFRTNASRYEHQDALDAHIGEWTGGLDPYDAMYLLQAAGVPAGVVATGEDLFHDPHLRARDYITGIDHPLLGEMPLAAVPMRLAEGAVEPARGAARLGEDNEYVYCDILGYSREQLAAWQQEGIVE